MFESADRLRLIDQIVHEPPVPPRQLDRKHSRATWRRSSSRRWPRTRTTGSPRPTRWRPSCGGSWRTGRSVRGRSPAPEQFWRWCKRNPGLATANIAAATLTTILAVVSTIAAFIYYDRNYQVVQDNLRIQARRSIPACSSSRPCRTEARAGRFSRQMGQRFDSLDALAKAAAIARELKLPRERLDPLRDEAIACLALPDLKPTGRVITKPAGSRRQVPSTRP